MLKTPSPAQQELEMVTLEQLVPTDHLLRSIDRHIDLEFIRAETAHLYSADNGRPAVDPVVLFKMLMIGYLFGIRSERQLVREIQVNVAYRWFLGYRLTDKIPDASTISQNRRRRFVGTDIEQRIFDQIVHQAIGHGLIGGRVLYTDSTHVKANANKGKFQVHTVEQNPKDYLEQLNAAIDEDRVAHGKEPLAPDTRELATKEIKVSKTDADSGYMTREGKPQGFFYLDHRTVDGVHALIVDTHITPASTHDSVPYLSRLDRIEQQFDLGVGAVGLDAGYDTAAICKGLEDRNIYGVMGYRRPTHREGYLRKREFIYDPSTDQYECPNGQRLNYVTTNRIGYREYHSQPSVCKDCPMRSQCTQSQGMKKVVTRHVWQDSKERVNEHRLSATGKKLYARRKETVERSFADAKQLHGYRYARFRGLNKMRSQALMVATCQNMKKIARLLARALLGSFYGLQRTIRLTRTLYMLGKKPIDSNLLNRYQSATRV